MNDPIKGHAARVRAADPLVAGQDVLPGSGVETLIQAPGAVGTAAVDRIDPDAMRASWSPLVVHRLQARVAGPDPEAALGGLLDRWLAGVRNDEPGQALSVSWPSRDVAPVRALAVRGFAPIAVAAVRRLRPQRMAAAPTVRRATGDDVEAVTRMYRRLVDYDARFGWVTRRASTGERIRESVAAEVLPLEWCWLAEVGGRPAGCVIVQPPARSGWIARSVNDAPVAYLGVMYVAPSLRGQGVGAALTEVAHNEAAAQGVSSMVLHHALPNPLSTPFWARRGYRPLITQWVRFLGV
ncbi:Predicted N-acetyltransferase YhbS [Nonomuraea solani]|uniref:Predicted N-acetyltransferase YhbS n=1 Tax=Nonomuraea solani TaxID=1144553 RepID=A0A1H6F4T5_9ACTN|nr:GNAT family N-acetyltransferase [Nonomuraea solani]SEH04035.1 Predicted N-acetyltransferase YhbS [Nonomuraea solani]